MRGGWRAVAASVGLHLLVAVGLVAAGRWRADRTDGPPALPGIDTRADVTVRVIEPEVGVPVEVTPANEPPVEEPAVERPPLAEAVPAVVDVPLEPTPLRSPSPEPTPPRPAAPEPVRPATATVPARSAASPLDGGLPVHGALAAGQAVVYVLDASGSMGEWGKFDAARRALVATLRGQPETVRFQVVLYAGLAYVPLPATTRCVPATALNVARMADVLLTLGDPAGRSDHAAGLAKALELRPDVVVFVTDADGPPPAAFTGLLRRADPRPAVYVARVAADGVCPPAAWR